MVLWVLERAVLIGPPVVLATTTDPSDDQLSDVVRRAGYPVSRGSVDDVLDRFLKALPEGTRSVVRVTADCPLLDPAVCRAVLAVLEASGADYVTNALIASFPDGLDCSATRVDALEQAGREATRASDREHVTTYLWRQPERFRVLNLSHGTDLSGERWTVDDDRDLAFVRAIYDRLEKKRLTHATDFQTVLRVLEAEPELRRMNAGARRDEGLAISLERDRQAAADARGTPRDEGNPASSATE